MATMAELLNYKEQSRSNIEQAVTRQTLTESQQQAINDLNESVRVCRIETQRRVDEETRNEKIRKNALNSLRVLRRDRDSIIVELVQLTDYINEYVNDLRLTAEIELSNLTYLRGDKIVCKPNCKEDVADLRQLLETDFVEDRATLKSNSGQTLRELREKLHTLNSRITYFESLLKSKSPRSLPPRVERDQIVVRLIPLVNDESMWTEDTEADLAELYQSLTERVTELNVRVRPRNGYPSRPHTPLSAIYNVESPKVPTGSLDIVSLRNELTALCVHYNTMYDDEGETDRVDSVCNHLEYLARKLAFLTTDSHIVKRGRHYYMMSPMPSGTRN